MKIPSAHLPSPITSVAIMVFGLWSLTADSVRAQDFEMPPMIGAADILPAELVRGPNHKVDQRVTNDGYMNHYVIHSRYGRFEVISTAKLRKRIDEIIALVAIERVKGTDIFHDAVIKGGESAVRGVKNLVIDPINTARGTVSGIGKIFGRVEAVVSGSQRSASEESRVENLIGFANQKREYAAEFGVDAYSQNNVLQDELDEISWIGYVGELAPAAALAAVPGGAGAALTVTQSSDLLNEVFRTTSPIELRKMNFGKLVAMGVNQDITELFINNGIFSPREQTLLVAALDEMRGAQGREAFVKTATLADNVDLAYFRQRQAQMYAAYHKKVAPISTFMPIGQLAAAQVADGTVVIVVPLDMLTWTRQMGSFIVDVDAFIDQTLKASGIELLLAGGATQLARSHITALGWKLIEDAESELLPNLPY